MITKLRKDGKTVIVVSGSINHKYFLDHGFTDPSTHSPEPAPEPEPESISDPLEQEQEPKKPARRTRKKKTDED